MRKITATLILFIIITGFSSDYKNMYGNSTKPFCGVMSFYAENNTAPEDNCTLYSLGIVYPGLPITVLPINYSAGQSGNFGSFNTGGPAGTLCLLRLHVIGGCSMVRLYRNGILLQTLVGQPHSQFYHFYNVPSACAEYQIIVD
jgi:hypothetical protein